MIAAIYELDNDWNIRVQSAKITKHYSTEENLHKYGILPLLTGPYKLYKVQIFDDMINGRMIQDLTLRKPKQ
jgi:hypothetical protein